MSITWHLDGCDCVDCCPNPRDCAHGQHARTCDRCEDAETIKRLTALVSRLRARCEEVERDGHPCGSRQAAADLICILDEEGS